MFGDRFYDRNLNEWNDRRRRVSAVNDDPSMTKQSFSEDADANAIMRKYLSTGNEALLFGNKRDAVYGDFASSSDFLEMNLKVVRAREAFELLPAEVRDHFENDPAKMLEAVYDPERRGECLELGLFEKPIEGEPAGGTTPAPSPASGPPVAAPPAPPGGGAPAPPPAASS